MRLRGRFLKWNKKKKKYPVTRFVGVYPRYTIIILNCVLRRGKRTHVTNRYKSNVPILAPAREPVSKTRFPSHILCVWPTSATIDRVIRTSFYLFYFYRRRPAKNPSTTVAVFLSCIADNDYISDLAVEQWRSQAFALGKANIFFLYKKVISL